MYKKRKILKKQNRAAFKRLKHEYFVYFDNSIYSALVDRGKLQNKKANLVSSLIKKHGIRIKNIFITNKLFLEIIGLGRLKSKILDKKGVRPSITVALRPINDKIKRKELVLRSEAERYHIALKEIFDKEIRELLSQEDILNKAEEGLRKYPYVEQFRFLSYKIIEFAKNIANSSEEFNRFIGDILRDMLIINLSKLIRDRKRIFPNPEVIINAILVIYVPQGLLSTDLIILMSVLMEHAVIEKILKSMELIEDKKKRVFIQKQLQCFGLIKDEKDIADAEVMHLAIYGYKKRRVLVLTAEPRKDIDIRKKAYLRGVEAIIKNNLKYKDRLTQHPENIRIGKLIVVDFKKLNFSGITLEKIKVPYIR